jgi:hypothetical protein
MPFEIEGRGWELHVKRLGLQSRTGEPTRTYGAYQVFIDGQRILELAGHICERTGPGDNTKRGVKDHLRIREGRYALSTQFGKRYRSVGFTNGVKHPLPGFLVLGTGARTAILVHPGHPPNLYLSSIGCLNPTRPLKANQMIDFDESRARVIRLIDSLQDHDPAAFARKKNTSIADAFIVIDGEPMKPVDDGAIA